MGSVLPMSKTSPAPAHPSLSDAIVLKSRQLVDSVWVRRAASRGSGQRRRRPSLPPPRRILHSGPFLLDRCHAAAHASSYPRATSPRPFSPLSSSPHMQILFPNPTPTVIGGGGTFGSCVAPTPPPSVHTMHATTKQHEHVTARGNWTGQAGSIHNYRPGLVWTSYEHG